MNKDSVTSPKIHFHKGHTIKELVENIARALVDDTEAVDVRAVEGSQVTVFEVRTHRTDLGKVIGRDGRTAKAIRTLLGAIGMKLHKRFTLEIIEEAKVATAGK